MPPSSPPTSPPPTEVTSQSPSTLKWTRKATRLRSLATRPAGADRPVVHVDPATRKADGPHKKKLRTYLGIVARDKVDMTYENWKQVPAAQKDLIWEDIQVFYFSSCILFISQNFNLLIIKPNLLFVRLNLISLKHLTLGQKRKYFRLWGSGGDSLSLI